MSRIKLEALPDDLLYHIISHLQVQDIVRLRQVCTNLVRITGERTVWLNAYRDASFLRPPGPHPHQSTKELEDCLVKAVRLHANWSSPSPQPVERKILPMANLALHSVVLVLGRFLLVGKLGRLSCYDLDSVEDVSLPIASYRTLSGTYALDFCVVIDADGGKSAIIALFSRAPFFSSSVMVLKMLLPPSRVAFQLELTTETEWRPSTRFARTMIADDYLLMSSTTFEAKIFHLPTRRYYCIPELGSWVSAPSTCLYSKLRTFLNQRALESTNATLYHEYHLTSTHLIDFSMSCLMTMVQAFLLPHVDDQIESSPPKHIPALTRTHVGYCDITFAESQLLHPSTPNPGSFTFMAFEPASNLRPATNNLILVDTILSSHGTITVTKKCTTALGMNYNMICTSCNGITRAISYCGLTAFGVCGYTVDDSDGTSVEQRALPIHENHMGQVIGGAFDGYRGRLCLSLESPSRIEIHDYV